MTARTTFIPPEDPSKPRFQPGRFVRNISQPGQSSGQTGQGPSTGVTPGVVSPQSGQIRPTAPTKPSSSLTQPATSQTPSSVVSPTRPVSGANTQKPVNAAMTNRPTGEKVLKPTRPAELPTQRPPLVPVEGKIDLSGCKQGKGHGMHSI